LWVLGRAWGNRPLLRLQYGPGAVFCCRLGGIPIAGVGTRLRVCTSEGPFPWTCCVAVACGPTAVLIDVTAATGAHAGAGRKSSYPPPAPPLGRLYLSHRLSSCLSVLSGLTQTSLKQLTKGLSLAGKSAMSASTMKANEPKDEPARHSSTASEQCVVESSASVVCTVVLKGLPSEDMQAECMGEYVKQERMLSGRSVYALFR
jgi:hypothetical protein